MPVAIAPVDGQFDAVGGELGAEGGDEGPVLVVDGTATAEVLVVLRHLGQSLRCGATAPGDVLEEGHDVLGRQRGFGGRIVF